MTKRHHFIERLSWLLDESITLPNGYKIGLDGFIGLIPGLGDLIGGSLSSVIIYHAHRLGVPRPIISRMVINMLIDTVIGSIPILGDLFDFVWKANKRNVALLNQYQADPQKTTRRSRLESYGFLIALIGILLLAFWVVIWLISLLWQALASFSISIG